MTYSNLLFASVILPLSVLVSMFDRSAEYKNLILCVTSLLFIIWGKAFAVALIFAAVIADYFLGIAAEGSLKRSKQSAAVFLIVDLIWNAFIFVLLTRNFIFANDSLLHLRNALLPVGAAYFALKNFSYVYDVYSERIKAERNIFCLLTYSAAYPFLLAGPVVRYGDIEPQIRRRTLDTQKLGSGITSFAIGLAKTVLVAPVLTQLYEAGLSADEPTLAGAWIGMAAFFGAAYFTLMGLSDMGTGIARMNGFDVGVNYAPITVKHMLGGLVKSYNTSMVKLFEDIRGDSKAAPVLTFFLAILGTAFYADRKMLFIFGAVTGLLLAAEYAFGYDKIEKIPAAVKLPVLFLLSMLLFSGFAFGDMSEWKTWAGQLIGKGDLYTLSKSVKYIIINNCWLLLIALVSVTPAGRGICDMLERRGKRSPKAYTRVRTLKTICTAVVFAASYIMLAAQM